MTDYNKSLYKYISQESVSEINSDVQVFTHIKSGAKLMFVLNDDDNKVFNVSFMTPPVDDTGVAHIMEHSVLCGSRKYPVKEPFVELMKSSLNTFLNAMTYPDKTIYPVASRNHKDFRNLVDVYMDAVFFPTLSKDAFEQEGWHYKVEDEGLSYKGVVYNEMKGVFSSPESYLDLHVNRALFPESTYHYESGGYPENIPDLSYEEYLKFHHEKYHPANSWIIIYGDVDRDFWLDYIDEEYLASFNQPDFQLPELIKQPVKTSPSTIYCSYPSNDECSDESAMISLSFLTGEILDLEKNFAMGVLDAILIGSSGSPLKKALLESGLGGDTLDYGYGNETLQTTWSVGLRDANAENKQAFIDLVFSELKKYSETGLPAKMVEAALNICEFQLREANYGSYPKGLVCCTNIMNQWLYGGDATAGLKYEDLLASLKSKVKEGGYFEALIKEAFLDNPHYVIAVCTADREMEASEAGRESEQLNNFNKSLSEKDKSLLLERNKFLLSNQMEPDSEEALATIPHVSKEDILREVEEVPQDDLLIQGVPVLYHDLPTQGIAYLQLSFDCESIELEDYQWLALMNSFMLKVGTSHVEYDDFIQDMACETGGMSSTINIFSTQENEPGFGTHLWIQTKLMQDKFGELKNLFKAIFLEIDFSNVKRIKELLGSMLSRMKVNLQSHGDRTSRSFLGASLSKAGYLGNFISGPEYFEFLKKVQKTFESSPEKVISKLQSVQKQLICRKNLQVNVTASRSVYAQLESHLGDITELLPEGDNSPVSIEVPLLKGNTGFIAPGTIQYVVKGFNINDLGFKSHGSYDLVNQLLSTGYLWDKVRVQGGAYGCHLTFDRLSGALMLASYRDPNLQETLDVFDGIGDFLENLILSESAFEKLIIGTFGRLDTPLTSSQKGKLAFNRQLTGVTTAEINQLRGELLDSTVDDLRSYAKYFKILAKKGSICIHGSESRISESKNLFDQILTVGE